MGEKVSPLEGQVLRHVEVWNDYGEIEVVRPKVGIEDATVITSEIEGSDKHKILLDIDFPVKVIESSPGHSHLYIDKEVSWVTLQMIMDVLVEAEVVERGFEGASRERGFTCLRLPWIPKGQETEHKKGFPG